MHKSLSARIIAFVLSLILTVVSFYIIIHPAFSHFGLEMVVITILILAVLQFTVQAIFFLNLLGEGRPRWNLIVFLSTLSILFVIIFFSIWVMDHLNKNMMPKM